mmetsp:Transcript_10690/g.32956  ORF Transcript_10690/g.32956 Transcript_10690/m.32956 type:complete len:82 (-) Transcript_10690:161-406(-)
MRRGTPLLPSFLDMRLKAKRARCGPSKPNAVCSVGAFAHTTSSHISHVDDTGRDAPKRVPTPMHNICDAESRQADAARARL